MIHFLILCTFSLFFMLALFYYLSCQIKFHESPLTLVVSDCMYCCVEVRRHIELVISIRLREMCTRDSTIWMFWLTPQMMVQFMAGEITNVSRLWTLTTKWYAAKCRALWDVNTNFHSSIHKHLNTKMQ